MGLLSLEQDETLVWADFAVYGLLVLLCGVLVVLTLPAAPLAPVAGVHHWTWTWTWTWAWAWAWARHWAWAWQIAAWVLAGWAGWSLAEYGLHRFVLHGLQPFARLHALHHARPQAHVATPTVVTTALFALLVAVPAGWWLPPGHAAALMGGVLGAYLVYIGTHHAVHHGHGASAWLARHKRWHALHHRVGAHACYGVSGPLWDHVFGTACPHIRRPVRQRDRQPDHQRVRQRTDIPTSRP
jgi:cyclopropane-fatty-acyl-phospholipid synthase